jgi:hypothetical protein
MSRLRAPAITTALATLALAGCSNPDTAPSPVGQTRSVLPGTAGEPDAPPAPSAAAQAPVDVAPNPAGAIRAFAERYMNWSYRTLSAQQRTLAAEAVGPARLAEQQAAATTQSDSTITRGHIHNSGVLTSVSPDLAKPGSWVITTREETSGDPEYQGVPAAYHVTLAQLAPVPGGYAVKQWLPQS